MTDTASIIAISISSLISIIVIVLSYYKDLKIKRTSEIYQKKTSFYLELVDMFNKIYYGEPVGKKLAALYNKSIIISSDDIIHQFNEFYVLLKKRDFKVNPQDMFPIVQELFLACRKDIGIKTELNLEDIISPYK